MSISNGVANLGSSVSMFSGVVVLFAVERETRDANPCPVKAGRAALHYLPYLSLHLPRVARAKQNAIYMSGKVTYEYCLPSQEHSGKGVFANSICTSVFLSTCHG